MYDRDGDGHNVRFDTWGELLAYVKQPVKPIWQGSEEARIVRDGTDKGFTGTHTQQEAFDLAERGWTEGEKRAKELSEKMMPALLQGIVREDWRFDVEGSTFDVARYVEGEPEHWIAADETFERGLKTVRVVVNLTASAAIKTDAMMARGIGVCALVEALQYAGIKVEIWAVQSSELGPKARFDFAALLKNADQPIEPSRVAFALAHPSFYRRIVLDALLHTDRKVMSGGIPQEATDWNTGKLFCNDENTIYFKQLHAADPNFATVEATKAWVFGTLAKYGVQVRGINAD